MNKNNIDIDPIRAFQSYIDNRSKIAPPDYDGPTREAEVCGMCYSEDSFVKRYESGVNVYFICGVCGTKNASDEIVG